MLNSMTKKGFLGVSELLCPNPGSIWDFPVIVNTYLASEYMGCHSVLEPNDVPTALPGTELTPSHKQSLLWSFHLMKMFLERWKRKKFKQPLGKEGYAGVKCFT